MVVCSAAKCEYKWQWGDPAWRALLSASNNCGQFLYIHLKAKRINLSVLPQNSICRAAHAQQIYYTVYTCEEVRPYSIRALLTFFDQSRQIEKECFLHSSRSFFWNIEKASRESKQKKCIIEILMAIKCSRFFRTLFTCVWAKYFRMHSFELYDEDEKK